VEEFHGRKKLTADQPIAVVEAWPPVRVHAVLDGIEHVQGAGKSEASVAVADEIQKRVAGTSEPESPIIGRTAQHRFLHPTMQEGVIQAVLTKVGGAGARDELDSADVTVLDVFDRTANHVAPIRVPPPTQRRSPHAGARKIPPASGYDC
jgi:hypothetical protein